LHYEFVNEFINEIAGKKVYIAINYHSLSKIYQNRLVNDPNWRADTFRSMNEYKLINEKYPEIGGEDYEHTFFDIKKIPRLFRNLYFPKELNLPNISIANDTLSIENTIQRHWRNSDHVLSDSIQRNYIEKLILLLKENNCEVVLLKMPVTNFYFNNVPFDIKNELSQIAENNEVKFLNLNSALNISKDYTYFTDYGHLNSKGGKLVRDYLESLN
jgi:hypothetical protein